YTSNCAVYEAELSKPNCGGISSRAAWDKEVSPQPQPCAQICSHAKSGQGKLLG
ncbi:hypothetical protein NXS19_003409, partial [Fusarium pseudograminearum]